MLDFTVLFSDRPTFAALRFAQYHRTSVDADDTAMWAEALAEAFFGPRDFGED